MPGAQLATLAEILHSLFITVRVLGPREERESDPVACLTVVPPTRCQVTVELRLAPSPPRALPQADTDEDGQQHAGDGQADTGPMPTGRNTMGSGRMGRLRGPPRRACAWAADSSGLAR
jgi:hypothetical protein